jgi:GAF domain
MSENSSLDRESFQELLASAFAVQESEIDSQFLSAILEVQRLVNRGDIGIDGVMNLVVDSARDVANAAGVAIGLLEGDQLIYRAGSGCSATRIGSRVAASLTVSAKTKLTGEILRVENAQTDGRIEGAICRQFGAVSILILPIYHDRALAGVLEILFSEPHTFQDREVRTHRLMTALIEAAMHQAASAERNSSQRKKSLTTQPSGIRAAGEDLTLQSRGFFQDYCAMTSSRGHALFERCGAAWAAASESQVLRQPALLAVMAVERATEVVSHKPLRSLTLTAIAAAVGLTLWIANGSRAPAAAPPSSMPPGASSIRHLQPGTATPAERARTIQPALAHVKEDSPATTRTRRMRGWQNNEVDYIGDDVTVRHFTYKPVRQPRGLVENHVSYIGEDVTVRYFSAKPAIETESQ